MFAQMIKTKKHVLNAVILRDMRTRFFDHGAGFLIVALWPLAHIFILVLINVGAGRQTPFGDSVVLFLSTGLVPTLAFLYVSRFMSYSLVMNRPLLAFPIVKVVDVMTARAFLEIIAAFLTLTFTIILLLIMGVDPWPVDLPQAVCAYLSTLLLAVGVGSLAGVIVMFYNFFVTIYALFTIVIYISSGTLFVAANLPEQVGDILRWNPVLVCVEWMRSSYYVNYPDRFVDRMYVVSFGLCCLCLGLVLERVFRRQMLES